ncbi:MAG: SDR family NAD(P)-dependent oxidoreductase, partial [Firmicutes bacterium]|nr:SDR family NAD(P)-dependent oxidoreductase [Candidatus Colimorpha enterica]
MKKTAVITGASGGIGSATALLFAEKGYNIVIGYSSNAEKADELKDRILSLGADAVTCRADMGDPDEAGLPVRTAIDVFGSVDCLINCAGISVTELIQLTGTDTVKRVLDVDLLGTVISCREAVPYM